MVDGWLMVIFIGGIYTLAACFGSRQARAMRAADLL
jgi:hypothetical protein